MPLHACRRNILYPKLKAAGQLGKMDSAALPIGEAGEEETVAEEADLSPAPSVSDEGRERGRERRRSKMACMRYTNGAGPAQASPEVP
jgi:hypothetical protein